MKQFVKKYSDALFVAGVFLFSKIYIFIIYYLAKTYLPTHSAFVAHQSRFANFDGIHYFAISQTGYGSFQQAFFPAYPLLISVLNNTTRISEVVIGILISNAAFLAFLYVLFALVQKIFDKTVSRWTVLFLLSFPTAFFFQAMYTESLFLLLVLSAFYLSLKKQYFLAFLIAGLASGTRVIGIFLLPSLMLPLIFAEKRKFSIPFLSRLFVYFILGISGLAGYMWYLGNTYSDPLLFIHSQSAFGANRSDGEIIILPQVLFRYVKILLTVHPSTLTFWVSVAELGVFLLGFALCIYALRTKIPKSFILFSFLALIFPTLSGTLSSMPRYALVVIIIPIASAILLKKHTYQYGALIVGFILQAVFAAIFFAGYFVS